MAEIQLDSWLINQIIAGKAILFLGNGATIGAKTTDGRSAPSSSQLRDLICDKFLDGKKKDCSLAVVSDYANTIASLPDVQQAIYEQYEDLQPETFHRIIPTFRWRAIFTTNYDLVIERAYHACSDRCQILVPILRDGDNLNDVIKMQNSVPYVKLHGCISVVNDASLPLILASEQYAKYERNRRRLFEYLRSEGQNYPIIFCGHKLEDPNIQHILFDLNDQGINRPHYVLVRPDLDQLDIRVWQSRRFYPLSNSFEEFLIHLNTSISSNQRALGSLIQNQALSVQRWFRTNQAPSTELVQYLQTELEHVHGGMNIEGFDPHDFYNGLTQSWGIFREQLDIRRKAVDDLLWKLYTEPPQEPGARIYLLRGYAGSGKNIVLRRTAWEAATDHDLLIFYLKEGSVIRNHHFLELHSLLGRRIVLFVDDVIELHESIRALIEYSVRQSIPLTVVCGARTNEWNVYGEELVPYVADEYFLRNLESSEVDILLKKLEKHGCLGHLLKLTHEMRVKELTVGADRQLLVALHEATSGKTFQDLVYDEYQNVVPDEARLLYLDICTLHRLRVRVRAGLINRVSQISFTDFRSKFLKPLEHVVRDLLDPSVGDMVYKSRHPIIARFVFERAMSDPEKKVDQITRLLKHMNVEFESDKLAFSQLIDGKALANDFGDRALADRIYETAAKSGADPSHVAHQRAVFEIHHKAGNLRKAMEYAEFARDNAQFGKTSIEHTQAVIYRRMALESNDYLERKKFREIAKTVLRGQQQTANAYSYSVLAQVYLDELREVLDAYETKPVDQVEPLAKRVLVELIGSVEKVIDDGLQRFPTESILLNHQFTLANLLQNQPAARAALESAHKVNPGNEIIAVRLARLQSEAGDNKLALATLRSCISENQAAKLAHFEIARIYMSDGEQANSDAISHHLYRGFTHGDTNFQAQLSYARHEFLYGNRQRAEEAFEILRRQKFPPKMRNERTEEAKDKSGLPREFFGTVKNITGSYCFASIVALNTDLFIYSADFSDVDWQRIGVGSYISCNLAFTLRGPCGIHAQLIDR